MFVELKLNIEYRIKSYPYKKEQNLYLPEHGHDHYRLKNMNYQRHMNDELLESNSFEVKMTSRNNEIYYNLS